MVVIGPHQYMKPAMNGETVREENGDNMQEEGELTHTKEIGNKKEDRWRKTINKYLSI